MRVYLTEFLYSIFEIRDKFLVENKRGSIFGFTKLLHGNDHYYNICTWLSRNHP